MFGECATVSCDAYTDVVMLLEDSVFQVDGHCYVSAAADVVSERV